MFRQRTSSQKAGEDLLASFRRQFPEIVTVASEGFTQLIAQTTITADSPPINHPSHEQRHLDVDDNTLRDQDPKPRESHELWKFTPSLIDPSSYAFGPVSNAQPGYYIPTPGGNNMQFHSDAGDLHTPTLGACGINMPLPMPNTGESFHLNTSPQGASVQDASALTSFVCQDAAYKTMEQYGNVLEAPPPEHHVPLGAAAVLQEHQVNEHQAVNFMQTSNEFPLNAEKFRFHSTLNAPTAMVKHVNEIPITYLNKGQVYSLCIVDTSGSMLIKPGTKYRTVLRVSFEEDEQRQRPSFYWGLWKECRGVDGSHQRGEKLQAVEYVQADQPADTEEKRARIELESSAFDGFGVTWTPGANGPPKVNLDVRLNFLSTNFSYSKGVRGISLRLCAKTHIVCTDGSLEDSNENPEVCFCKVKLFRDHGAARKLSNDIAHVKKHINKLNQQLVQLESGMKDIGKRKRINHDTKGKDSQRPCKVQKHKLTWSMSSASSAEGGDSQMTLEEDLQIKLQTLQHMFASIRPVSIFCLRGEDLDDPDLHPIYLLGDISLLNKLDDTREGPDWQPRSTKSLVPGPMISPPLSCLSFASQASSKWQKKDDATLEKAFQQLSKISCANGAGTLGGWIEALEVETSCEPHLEQVEKPVACFYVQYQTRRKQETPSYHRAIYLAKRTLEEFNSRVATRWGIEPAKVLRSIHVIQAGLEIEMDDEVIRELKDGQDMRLEIEGVINHPARMKHEWESSANDDAATLAKGFVLRIYF